MNRSRSGHCALNPLATLLLAEIGEPSRPPLPADLDGMVGLYRHSIEALNTRVARGDNHAPMTGTEVAMMYRCALSCARLDAAIHCMADFCEMLRPRAGALSLWHNDSVARFSQDSLRRHPTTASFLVDTAGLLSYLEVFGWLIGEPLRPSVVTLGFPDHHAADSLLGLFGSPVITDASGVYGFTFDVALLARPVLRRPAELDTFLADFPYRALAGSVGSAPLRRQVEARLELALAHGEPLPDAIAMAAEFGMGEATLRRRLAAENIRYSALLERCRHHAALRYLGETDWSIEYIAERLDFSSAATFRRAFRRWTGTAPSKLRGTARTHG